MEKYMIIPGFDNYAISNKGTLKNVKNGNILKLQVGKTGYQQYTLCQNGIKKTFKIHRLVALAFIPNPERSLQVNHKDGNKLNNTVSNLEWCTAKENDTHARLLGLKAENKPIEAIEISTSESTLFYSIGEASTYLSINRGTIHKVLSGKYKKTTGYIFKYV